VNGPSPDDGSRARRVALDALVRIERDGAYANLALGPMLDRSTLGPRERALVTELVYGTLRRRRACDHLVDRFLSKDPPLVARCALRLGAFQLQFTAVPDHAAVAATVGASPPRYRGLVNAVLRKVAQAPVVWPSDAVRLSYPDWIVDRLVTDLGADRAVAALEAMNQAPRVEFRDDGYVQDRSSQRVVEVLGVGEGDLVVDLCAAPGGKATGLATARSKVLAVDRRPGRVALMAANVGRLGLGDRVSCVVADATCPPFRGRIADAVLVDAPCSGLGALGRRADARWRVDPDDVGRLAQQQVALLDAAVELIRPGGTLVYSVCTLTRAETVEVAERFTAAHDHVQPEPLGEPWGAWGNGGLLLPGEEGEDGMACFRWRVSSTS
jgi:16S rRNA (cytosine967-C5)-methyltransferase